MQISRRTVLPSLLAAFAFKPAAKPGPQPTDFGFVDSGDYPNLQAAANAAFGSPANPNGTAGVLNNKTLIIRGGVHLPPFSGAPVLDLRYLHGGRIIGSGRFVTKLVQNVAGVPVIRTNGCGYSHFEGMLLEHQVGVPGTCLDLNWDGSAGGANLSTNTFSDISFFGGSYGVEIGKGGFMGSENLFQNCKFTLCSTAGIATLNHNALQQSVIGGDFDGCGIAIWSAPGSVPIIHGVGFQQQTVCDIRTESNPRNNMSVVGCRTESANFIDNAGGHNLKVDACVHTALGANGFFVRQVGGNAAVSCCQSTYGNIVAQYSAILKVENSGFEREDWLVADQPWYFPNNRAAACTEAENVWFYNALGELTYIRKRRYESSNGSDFNVQSNYVVA